MYGANFIGYPYLGQAFAETDVLALQTISATVTVVASLTLTSIVNQVVSATVTTVASISRSLQRTLDTAVVITVGSLSGLRIKALSVLRGLTKLLTKKNSTKDLTPRRVTKGLNGMLNHSRHIPQFEEE